MYSSRILSREEIAAVLIDLAKRAKHSEESFRSQTVFRLSCCCGLRAKEICGLNVNDVLVTGNRPAVRVRKAVTKGQLHKRRARIVPLWIDAGTLADLAKWQQFRLAMGATSDSPFICSLRPRYRGNRIDNPRLADRIWRNAIRGLGKDRVKQVSIHAGRHTFGSHAVRAGVPLPIVRDWMGHANIAMTSIYLHAVDEGETRNIFSFEELTRERA